MIDQHAAYPVLALIAIYAAVFFLSPNRLAGCWERDDLPVHEIMQHFRYWERLRVWISGIGLAAGVILTSLPGASVIVPIAMFVGLMALTGADAFQVRRLSRDLPSWSPSVEVDQMSGGTKRSTILDLLFGKRPTSSRRDRYPPMA